MNLVQLAKSLKVGEQLDYRVGLSTKDISRESKTTWVITDTVDGWNECVVTLKDLAKIVNGTLSYDELNWV